jgi:hypothetical protein
MKKLQGKVALDDPTSPIPTVDRLATGPPLAKVGWETVDGSGPRRDFEYPAIHSIVSEVLGSWASFMRGIQL